MIPPGHDAEFVCRTEQVLDVYERPYAPTRPVVCVGEASAPLIGETRHPVPARPGQPARVGYEYPRNGTADPFVAREPLLGWRAMEVTARRTAADFAAVLKLLADDVSAAVARITRVLDNLNAPKPSVLYEAFAPADAHRSANRFEFVDMPKHGSWLNMAELEFAALRRQGLRRRIGSMDEPVGEVTAWQDERNDREVVIPWQFTTDNARSNSPTCTHKLNRNEPLVLDRTSS